MRDYKFMQKVKYICLIPLAASFALSSCATVQPTNNTATTPNNDIAQQIRPVASDIISDPQTGQSFENELYPGTGQFLGNPKPSNNYIRLSDQEVSLNFENADLREAVEIILGETLGLSYIFDPAVVGTVSLKTTAPLPANSVLEILETMLRMNGAALVVEDRLYKIIPMAMIGNESFVPEIAGSGQRIPAGYNVLLVPLQYVSVSQMDKILEPFITPDTVIRLDQDRNVLVLGAPGFELSRIMETIALFDVDLLKGKSVGMFRLNYVNAEVAAQELNILFSSGPDAALEGMIRFVPITRLNALMILTTQPSYLEKAETWIRRLDKGDETGQNLYVHYLQNGKASEVAEILNQLLSGRSISRNRQIGVVAPGLEPITLVATPNGITSDSRSISGTGQNNFTGTNNSIAQVVADEANNALLIRSSEKDFRMIKSTLQKMDIVPLQVLIEATIAEVTLTDEMRFGLQWYFNTGGLGNGYTGNVRLANGNDGSLVPSFPGFSGVVNDSTGGIRGVLDALEGVTSVNVISSPHLMALNNHTAELQVGDEVPVITQQQQNTTNINSTLVNTVQFRDTGVILKVTPRVSSDGTINMEIEQEVSNVVQAIDSGALTPTISQRMVKSTIVAQSGETIVLGGLISDQEINTRSGLPFVSRIPVFGSLFSRTEINKTRTELLVLISPKIVRNATEARRVTQELQDRLQGIEDLENRLKQ